MKVEYNDDSLPKGSEVFVNGLGTLVNGKEVEFDDEALAVFEAETGQTVAEAFKDSEKVKLSGAGSRATESSPKKEGGE